MQVEVWALWLIASPEVLETYRSFLSQKEKDRAARFVFDRHRDAYVLSQGGLRLLIGHYLNRVPEDITFTFGPKGKPALKDDPGFGFNKSDSKQLALYAFSNCELGVDVEEGANRDWTRYEACVKASGQGLNEESPSGWTVHELDPAPGYVAAIAYLGPERTIRFHEPINPAALLESCHTDPCTGHHLSSDSTLD